MAYYVELTGGDIQAVSILNGGDAQIATELSGGDVYPSGGGSATLQTKSVSITPTESTQTQQITPDVGFDGLSEVDLTTAAIPASYVGSGVPRKTSADLTSLGAAVTAPAGYYENAASKAIPNASQALTDAYVQSSGDLEVELNTSSGGYVANGNQYLQFENFTTPVPTTTYYATSSDQVIMSQNSMAFGAQTIKGVTTTNLLASNIKKDVVVEVGDSADPDRIVSVTGTYEGGGGSWTEQTIATSGAVSQALNEFVWYHFTGSLTSLTITLNTPTDPQYANYRFDFNSGNPAVTLSLPNTITMPTDFSVKRLRKYEIDILGTTGTVSETYNRYRYSTTDGTLFYAKGSPPTGGGTNWKVSAGGGSRSMFALYESEYNRIDSIPWGSDTTGFPAYGTEIYPIPIPSDATGVKVTIPNRRVGPSLWTFSATGVTRVVDGGWQTNTGGTVTYSFTPGAYQFFLANIDSGTLESSVTLEFLTD